MFLKFKISLMVLLALSLMPIVGYTAEEISAEEAIRATEELYAEQNQMNYFMYRKPYKKTIKESRLDLKTDFEDVTHHHDTRVKDLKVGVDYKIDESNILGVAVSREIHDFQDASSWNRDVKAEEAVAAKYKLKF